MTAEAEIIRDLAFEAVTPADLHAGHRYAWRKPDGTLEEVDLTDDLPAFRTGAVTVLDVASFTAYWEKHSDSGSAIYASQETGRIAAVLDDHFGADEDAARWRKHRLTLALELTDPWKTWLAMDGKLMPQVQFAEFLEDNYADIAPGGAVKAADLLEVAQQFHATTKVEFGAGSRLSSGETRLEYTEATTASGGRKGEIKVPNEFDLAIKPYDDCPPAKVVTARFRYRTTPEGLRLAYRLNHPERIRQQAVRDITAAVAEACGQLVLLGTPG